MASFNNPLDMAKTQVALRALRYGHFPADIFDEYAWDMMLHMYIAALRDQTIYVDNVVNLTSKNKLIGDRWIAHLIKDGMVVRNEEKVALSESCLEQMNSYHLHALELLEP
jgi:hypothetical protein